MRSKWTPTHQRNENDVVFSLCGLRSLHYSASAHVQRTKVTRVRRSDCGNLP
ncbi:TPA: hypothetical protein N0F65_003525 [Lagenidium giganteum]|uniref:Uncharacterized protein n=1 Tax=Lagenidium giganteum TaxID=4803 RepID=A0AAV2Z102_9STRA|nr:TPA: hypothetical protein N0F65_003525 [Lagenidium giganteum]